MHLCSHNPGTSKHSLTSMQILSSCPFCFLKPSLHSQWYDPIVLTHSELLEHTYNLNWPFEFAMGSTIVIQIINYLPVLYRIHIHWHLHNAVEHSKHVLLGKSMCSRQVYSYKSRLDHNWLFLADIHRYLLLKFIIISIFGSHSIKTKYLIFMQTKIHKKNNQSLQTKK